MILRNATILYSGRNPDKLSKWSKERICVSCDECGRIRWIRNDSYRALCINCSQKAERSNKWKPRIKLTCQQCGKEFEINERYKNTAKFCSTKCYGKWNSKNIKGKDHPAWKGGKVTKICEICGKEFEVIPAKSNSKFCSNKCKGKAIRGKNSIFWNGGCDRNRSYVLPESQCRKINERFEGSHFHHLTKSIGIYIPKELHKHLYHNMKSGQGIDEMNILSFQFIKGEL